MADILPYAPDLARAALTTVILTVLALLIGSTTGLGLAVLMLTGKRSITVPTSIYVDFFRTTPPLIQLLWFYYTLPVVTGIEVSAFQAVAVGLGLNVGAFMSEVYRAGLLAIPRGQWQAASTLGLSRSQTFRLVVLPQAIKIMIPPMAAMSMLTMKNTSLAAQLAVLELTYAATLVAQRTYAYFDMMTVLAILYLVMVYPIAIVGARLERHLRISDRVALS